MQWYKHQTSQADDVQMKRFLRKHGAVGYGVYNYIVERIVRELTTDSPMPFLEETAEDIAHDLKTDTLEVERIVQSAGELGLLDIDALSGRVAYHAIYKMLDKTYTRSDTIKEMIDAYKKTAQIEAPETRTEENRIEVEERSTDCPRTENPTTPSTNNEPEEQRSEESEPESESGAGSEEWPILHDLCKDAGVSCTDSELRELSRYAEDARLPRALEEFARVKRKPDMGAPRLAWFLEVPAHYLALVGGAGDPVDDERTRIEALMQMGISEFQATSIVQDGDTPEERGYHLEDGKYVREEEAV